LPVNRRFGRVNDKNRCLQKDFAQKVLVTGEKCPEGVKREILYYHLYSRDQSISGKVSFYFGNAVRGKASGSDEGEFERRDARSWNSNQKVRRSERGQVLGNSSGNKRGEGYSCKVQTTKS